MTGAPDKAATTDKKSDTVGRQQTSRQNIECDLYIDGRVFWIFLWIGDYDSVSGGDG